MTIKNCAICDTEYAPDAHFFHCPSCGTMSSKIGGHLRDYSTMRPIARGLPRWNIDDARLVHMARAFAD